MRAAHNNRWSLAFADLSLLLLAFTVLSLVQPMALLQSESADKGAQTFDFPAVLLFESGEAMLSPAGLNEAEKLAGLARRDGLAVELSMDAATSDAARLDRWELSAARMAAFARALHDAGLADTNIIFGSQSRRTNSSHPHLYISLQPAEEEKKGNDGTSLASYLE